MTDQSHLTKVKIMEAARILFADHGFEGASVRDIAKAADVNIASVNYHFSNKENLFSEILNAGYLECSSEVRDIYEKSGGNLEETLVGLFRYFMNKSHDLVSMFKMMMSTQHAHHLKSQGKPDEMMGPPGGKVISEAILKEAGPGVAEEDLFWAMRCLFSHVVHLSLMYNCCFKDNKIPYSSDADIEKSIRRLSQMVIQDLRKK